MYVCLYVSLYVCLWVGRVFCWGLSLSSCQICLKNRRSNRGFKPESCGSFFVNCWVVLNVLSLEQIWFIWGMVPTKSWSLASLVQAKARCWRIWTLEMWQPSPMPVGKCPKCWSIVSTNSSPGIWKVQNWKWKSCLRTSWKRQMEWSLWWISRVMNMWKMLVKHSTPWWIRRRCKIPCCWCSLASRMILLSYRFFQNENPPALSSIVCIGTGLCLLVFPALTLNMKWYCYYWWKNSCTTS